MQLKLGIIFLFISFIGLKLSAQSVFDNVDTLKYPYHLWSEEVIEAANTAKNTNYMSEEEKNLIWLSNLARFDGYLFGKTFLKDYIETHQIKYTSNVKSLFKDLSKSHKLPMLKPDKGMYALAKKHAEWSGKKGKTGHQRFNERAKKSGHSKYSENCQYGYFTAIDILIDLLIDDGVPSLGHRKNILNKEMMYTAVSIQPHKVYKYNCVIEYAG